MDASSEFRWKLIVGSRIIADSGEGYKIWQNAIKGLASTKQDPAGTPLQDKVNIRLAFFTSEHKKEACRKRLKELKYSVI